ncbi:MAG TPA: XRE family transcriptional regulator [Lachnospiraceae bacterium]|nr:XRE family transcriptional regulator [Lachnospiraceae bacterium]
MTDNIIGRNIKSLRGQRNMTQEQLAQKMYMKRQTLSNYEVGKRMPDIFELWAMADIFEVSLDEIAGRGTTCTKERDCKR